MRRTPFSRPDRPLVWGHRGASAEAPENTLAAFELAQQRGADGVELDVQRCASGEVVVMHDESLGRTTGFAGLVRETPWRILRTLDAGARKAPRWAGTRVPLLAEVLGATALLVNVELKCDRWDDGGLTKETIRCVHEAGAAGRVLLSSFNPVCLARARALGPEIARALLFEADAAWPLRNAILAPGLGLAALHPQAVLASQRRVSLWRRLGYSVAAWTVDDPDEASRLWQAGVNGIITNRPDRMRARWP